MSKRTPRQINTAHDFVETPEEAVLPLVPQLAVGTAFYEPCVGNGALVRALEKNAMAICVGSSDIRGCANLVNATHLTDYHIHDADCFITNPPWRAELLHPIIENLVPLRPTWLLLYSDWLFTRQAVPYQPWIRTVVTMPRVIWISGTKNGGYANCCWVLFEKGDWGFLRSGWK